PLVGAAAQIHRIEEAEACGVQLHDDGVTATAIVAVELGGEWEIRRGGPADDVGIVGTVHRDAKALVGAAASEVGGGEARCRTTLIGVEARDETVCPLAEGRLKAAGRRREIRRGRLARHVDDAGCGWVSGYAVSDLSPATAQVRGIDEHGVDDQRPRTI